MADRNWETQTVHGYLCDHEDDLVFLLKESENSKDKFIELLKDYVLDIADYDSANSFTQTIIHDFSLTVDYYDLANSHFEEKEVEEDD